MRGSEDVVALLVAAGSGSRAGADIPKQYLKLAGKTLLEHAVAGLDHRAIGRILVVIGPGQEALYREALGEDAPPPVIGGALRQQSVLNGLEAIAAEGGAKVVLIHDAARPFLPAEVVERLLAALEEEDGAVPVLPVVDSIARQADGAIGEPVPRDGLARVQTPQGFRFEAILDAHRRWRGEPVATDDAQVARAAGYRVAAVEGDRRLEKLTYGEDFERAARLLEGVLTTRVGMGFDVHALAEGEELWLGGLLIPHSKGLKGHSDADVVLHALTDALLGAVAEGDIGDHFPPSDPRWRGAASSRFVEHARDLVLGRGGAIDHVDLTIICEAPKIGPHKDSMRTRIAGLLQVGAERVSLKATTTERLGFTGRGEGIAAQAIATVRLPGGI